MVAVALPPASSATAGATIPLKTGEPIYYMNWTSAYQSHIVRPQQAVRVIKSGNRIFLSGNVSVPQKVLCALVEYAPNINNVEICQALSIGPAAYVTPEMKGHL